MACVSRALKNIELSRVFQFAKIYGNCNQRAGRGGITTLWIGGLKVLDLGIDSSEMAVLPLWNFDCRATEGVFPEARTQ